MCSAFSISASGLAASAAQLSKAAGKVVDAFTGGPAPNVPQPQPAVSAPPAAAPVAGPLAGTTKVAAQQSEPASWMVEILRAKAAYSANLAAAKAAEEMTKTTIDTLG